MMKLEDLYALHTDPSQLFGADIYSFQEFFKHLPERKTALEEDGEILNQRLKAMIKLMPHRDKEVEKFLLQPDNYTTDLIINYAVTVLKKRWPAGEKAIIADKDVWTARHYALMFNTRIPEFEPMIMQNPDQAYLYAQDTIEGRWKEAEPYILKDTDVWYEYKDRWGIDAWSPDEPL